MLSTCARLGSRRCAAALGLWAVVFVLLSAVLSPNASAFIEAGRGAGAEFDVLDSRSRHGVSVLIDVATDTAEDGLYVRDDTSAHSPQQQDTASGPQTSPALPAAAISHSPPTT